MPKLTVHFNDYVSLAVMLLMIVALVAGQVDASAHAADKVMSAAPIESVGNRFDDRINIDFDGQLGGQALKVSIAVATDLGYFRGEDE
jgi:hypothetical protein